MEPEELKNLHQKEQHLDEWLRRYGNAKEIVPDVQKNLDMTRWEIGALEGRPTVAGEVPSAADLPYITLEDYRLTQSALPMMPVYNPVTMGTASSSTVSGLAIIYSHIAKYADIPDSHAIDFSNNQTKLYREIQEKQERPKQVRNLMQVYCSAQTLQRFDTATQAYLSTKSGAVTRMDAANAIRNTLDGHKGDLFERARKTPKENMTWATMSQRLAKGDDEREALLRNETIRTSVYSGLSETLKARSQSSTTNIDNLWTQTLDFIYAVLNLLKPIS